MNLALDELTNEDDIIVETNGSKVVYTSALGESLENATLDYADKWFSKGFRITGAGTGTCKL